MDVDRAYYHCPTCHRGFCPLDDTLCFHSSSFSHAVADIACLASVTNSYAQASEKILTRLSGLRISASSLEKLTETAGKQLTNSLSSDRCFGQTSPWQWHKDHENKTCAYVSVDATGVPMQGPKGTKADGRMVYIGMIANPAPEQSKYWANPQSTTEPKCQSIYVTSLSSLEDLATMMRAQAARVGMDRADRWLGMSDAGAGIECFLKGNFGRIEEVILDFFHAAERLGDLAKICYGSESPEAAAQFKEWRQLLKSKGGESVLEQLRERQSQIKGEGAKKEMEGAIKYFENQKHRMDYPRYLDKGWAIGSGPVEAGCKTIGHRLKGAGMRWMAGGASNMAQLRAVFMSDPKLWDAFWKNLLG